MRVFRNILAVIVVLALCAGLLLYIFNKPGEADAPPALPGTVRINEFMASNSGYFPDDNGAYSDWIELYNPTDHTVSLSGLGLSDDNSSVKWAFPDISLAAGGYAVVFASGGSSSLDTALHANFKLNAGSGGIYLTDGAGAIIDQIEYKDQSKNVSMGRIDSGEWALFDRPTPGYSNDEAGYAAFEQSRYAGDTSLLITEVMASNRSTLADNKGRYSDYIEIVNTGAEPIELAGYGLSDDPARLLAWRFPEVTIQPGGHLLVFATGEDTAGTDLAAGYIHTSFRIAAYRETIVLSTPLGLIIDEAVVSEAQPDRAFARVLSADGAYTEDWEQTERATPGFPNSQQGYEDFLAANPVATGPVVISEVMASNSAYLQEADGGFYDWIELYNQSAQTVDLTGYGLTDNPGNPAKWRMPNVTLAPGEYTVVMASGLGVKKNYVHTNFKLSASGDVLALFDADGALQDKYIIEPVPYGVSVGRAADSQGIFVFRDPTPGAANAAPSRGVAAAPAPDVPGGGYGGAQQVALSCATAGASIHYTTDGTLPTQDSPLYTAPFAIEKTGMVRARAFADGYIESPVQTSTYIIGAAHSLPVLSIVTDPAHLFDPVTGIYELGPNARLIEGSTKHYEVANYLVRGRESERPASFEVFDESGKLVFGQDVGLRIQGGFSRDAAQKPFTIFARSSYGKSTMAYPFFDNRPFTEYKSLILRQGGQDQGNAKMREAMLLDLIEGKGLNVITQAYKPYVVYLNGEYWGVYFMMEKRNKYFIAAHENAPNEDEINILKAYSLVLQGSRKEYLELMDYLGAHDMSQQANYDYLAARVDPDSFMDLIINQIYIANSDHANLQFYQVLPAGKWKQVYYDFCWTFGSNQYGASHPTLKLRMTTYTGSTLFNAFLSNKAWRDKFIERFAWTLKEVYNKERVLAAIDRAADMVRDEIPAERAKFGGSVSNWEAHVDKLREFAKNRGAEIVRQLKEAFSLSDAQKAMLEDAIK